MTYHFPETATVGVAVLGISLPTIVCWHTLNRRIDGGFRCYAERVIVIPNITIDLSCLWEVVRHLFY